MRNVRSLVFYIECVSESDNGHVLLTVELSQFAITFLSIFWSISVLRVY